MAYNNETTTKFKVDISELKSAMQEAKRQISIANSEFKAVASSMDNWGKSTDGIKAKLTQLNSNLDSQKTILTNLERQYALTVEQMGEGSAEADKLRVAINNQQSVVNNTKREIERYTDQLDKAERAESVAAYTGRDATEVFDELGNEAEDAGKQAERSSDGFTIMKGAIANLVADGIRKGIDALKDFSKEMITTAATVKAENSQFEQAFGDLADEAESAIKRVAGATGILDTRLKITASQIYAFARASGAETTEAMELMETALMATADSAAYYDKSLEETSETLRSFLKGNFANDAALGVSATEFTRNAKAVELFGAKYNELTEIQKQQTLLKMVTDSQALSGAMGQAARESDGFENVMGNLNESWRQFRANVGTPFLENLIPIVQNVTDKFNDWATGINWDKFGKSVDKIFRNFLSKGRDLAKKTLPALKTAFEVVSKAVGFTIDNLDTIVAVAGTAVGSFVALKAAMAIANTITAFNTAVKGAEGVVTLATKSQLLWNSAMNANVIGAVTTAVVALTAGVAALILSQDEASTSTKYLAEYQREAIESATDTAEAYRDAKSAAEEMGNASVANIDYTRTLWNELKTLADENGNVKDSDVARAEFILGQLNDALGTEYTMNGNIIDQYADMRQSIIGVIEAKKAEILLQAYEESYRKAIESVAGAEKARAVQAQELSAQRVAYYQAESKAQEARASLEEKSANAKTEADKRKLASEATWVAELEANAKREKELFEEKTKTYNRLDAELKGYYSDIENYEKASTLALKGESTLAVGYLNKLGAGYKDVASVAGLAAEEQKEILKRQVVDTEVQLKLMEADYKATAQNMTAEEKAQAEARLENARQQAEDAKVEFNKVGGNLVKGIANGVANNGWVLNNELKNLIDNAVRAAKQAADIHSPSRLFRDKIGKFIGLGVAEGVDDSTRDVVKSVRGQVSAIRGAYGVTPTTGVNSGVGATASGTVNNFTQVINSPKALSRLEIYRQSKNLLGYAGGN